MNVKFTVLPQATFLISNDNDHVTCNFVYLAVNNVMADKLVLEKKPARTQVEPKNLVTKILLHVTQLIIIVPVSPDKVDFPVDTVYHADGHYVKFFGKSFQEIQIVIVKDVHAHCYCASLVHTLFIGHASPTSFSSARNESKTQQSIELMTFVFKLCVRIFLLDAQ